MNNTKKAFTLAETLITLTIIGVVACITIPSVIVNLQKRDLTTALQKAYSIGNQALQKAALDYCGGTDIGCIFNGNLTSIGDAISSEYTVTKNCKISTGQGCFAKYNENYDGSSGTYDDDDNYTYMYKFITTDGMTIGIGIGSIANNCTKDYGLNANSPTTKTCGWLSVDVNGMNKGPNNEGRDVFHFWITSNKVPLLYPTAGREDNYSNNAGTESTGGNEYWNYNGIRNACSPTASKWGQYCTGRVAEKGWTFDY